jgi:hypothetical protein
VREGAGGRRLKERHGAGAQRRAGVRFSERRRRRKRVVCGDKRSGGGQVVIEGCRGASTRAGASHPKKARFTRTRRQWHAECAVNERTRAKERKRKHLGTFTRRPSWDAV